MTLVATTTVFCRRCQASHPARIQREGDRICAVSECSHHPPPVELSDDAGLFLRLREGDLLSSGRAPGTIDRFPRGQIYITSDCNCRCPVCYLSAAPGDGTSHLSLPEILRRASDARHHGLRRLLLIGGEPTVHPELLAIVGAIRELGISVSLVTNGQSIGKRPELARQLKRAGLAHLNLQFDTLDRRTLRTLRGHDDLETKFRAIRHVHDAGLPLSLTVTVAQLNLPEIGALIRWAGALPVLPTLLLFQAMVPFGRFPADLATVSREAMINSALASGAVVGATLAHLHGVPPFPPTGLAVHPDCGSLLFALRRNGRLVPADSAMDIDGFYRAVAAVPADQGALRAWATWVVQFLRHIRPGHRRELLRAMLDLWPGRPNQRLMMVGFTSFCHPDFLDEQRLSRCGNFVLAAAGPEPVCGHFGQPATFNISASRTSR